MVASVYKWLWKSCCVMKSNMFSWLLLFDRLNARDVLHQRHWNVTEDTHGVTVCSTLQEATRTQSIYNFSVRIWNYLWLSIFYGSNHHSLLEYMSHQKMEEFFDMRMCLSLGGRVSLCRRSLGCSIELRRSIEIAFF
jgi:hypothetical protein